MNSKPRLLRILNRFNLGGPVYNASYLTKYLENDFDTLLIGGKELDEEESALYIPQSMGIQPIVIEELVRSVGLISEIKSYFRIKKIIKEFRPDIVHTHASKAGALGRLAAINSGVKIIVHTYHGHVFEHYFGKIKSKIIQSIERYLASKTQAIICISKKQKIDISERFKIAPKNKVHVIPLGFELTKFTENSDLKRREFREKYNLTENDVAIGIIGRLAPVKNHKLFIEGFADVKGKFKNIKAFVIGDGAIKKELESLAESKGIKTSGSDAEMIFTSWIKQVHEILPGLDIVALTSFNEGTPVSLIEAQAAGIAVVSSDVGGVSDIMGENCGLLFESNNKEEFVKKLSLLVSDVSLRKKMSDEGQKWALSKFTADRLADDCKKLYLDLLNRRN